MNGFPLKTGPLLAGLFLAATVAAGEEIGFEDVTLHFRHGLEAVVSGKKSSV